MGRRAEVDRAEVKGGILLMGVLRRSAITVVMCVVVLGVSSLGDHSLASWLAGHRKPFLTRFCDGMMWLGSSAPGLLLLTVTFIATCLLLRRLSTVGVVAAAVGCATVVCFVLKDLIQRPRPGPTYALVSAAGYSMPSTAEAMCAAMSVAVVGFAIHRRRHRYIAGSLLIVVNVAVGMSLMYLGAHWLSDVCAGAIVGAAVALLIVGMLRGFPTKGCRPASPSSHGTSKQTCDAPAECFQSGHHMVASSEL